MCVVYSIFSCVCACANIVCVLGVSVCMRECAGFAFYISFVTSFFFSSFLSFVCFIWTILLIRCRVLAHDTIRRVYWSFVRCHSAAAAVAAAVAVSAVVIGFFHFFPCAVRPHAVRPFHDHILSLRSHRGVVQFVLRNRVQCQYLLRNLQILHIQLWLWNIIGFLVCFAREFQRVKFACEIGGCVISSFVLLCLFACVSFLCFFFKFKERKCVN